MTVTSLKVALPIHFFWPLSTQVSPSRRAVVVKPPEVPEPTSGSVRPNAPIFSRRAIGGSPLRFFFSSPHQQMEPLPPAPWRRPEGCIELSPHPHPPINTPPRRRDSSGEPEPCAES